MTADEATYWVYQKPAKLMIDLKEIVTRRDLSRYLAEYLRGIEDFERFDMREIVAMTRAGGGGVTHPPLHHLRGQVPIDIAVEVLHQLMLAKVTIDLVTPDLNRLYAGSFYTPRPKELRRLYEGPTAPTPGQVVFDTLALPNGVYGLIVTAEDNRGIRGDHRTFFEVVNPK